MSDLLLLSEAQMRRIERYFPRSHGVARVDDRRIVSAIVFVIKNWLRWRDAPREYGPHKTIYNRFIRWSRWLCSTRFSPRWRARTASRSGS
jgi:putative transposase